MPDCLEKSTHGSPRLTAVADPQNPEVLNALVLLMRNLDDPSVLTDEQLVAAAVDARETKKTAETKVAAVLAGRGWSWRQIGKALDVHHSTAYGWVRDAGLLPEVEEALAARGARPEPPAAPTR